MKTVKYNQVSNRAMVAGNEKKIGFIIHNGVVKQWVGIGWVELREATADDKKKYPKVV